LIAIIFLCIDLQYIESCVIFGLRANPERSGDAKPQALSGDNAAGQLGYRGEGLLVIVERKNILAVLLTTIALVFSMQSTVSSNPITSPSFSPNNAQLSNLPKKLTKSLGVCSWYSKTDPAINLHTANGEIFDDTQMTCASWYFPFNTYLRVTNLSNGKSVICRVNDRGPAKRLNRIIDLSKSAFRKISDPKIGLIRVSITPVHARIATMRFTGKSILIEKYPLWKIASA